MTDQDMPNTVADAQMRLRQDMHGSIEWQVRASTDPEWLRRQLSPPAPEIKRSRRLLWLIAVPMVILGAIAIARGVQGAENPARFEIVAYPAGKDLREDRPNIVVIAGPYAGREECRIAIAGVKLANGSRLRCDRIEDRRVR